MIEQATIEDLDNLELHELGMRFYADSNLPGTYIPEVFRKNWTKFFELNCGAIFLFKNEGIVIGAIGGLIHPDPYDNILVAQEMFWFVSPDRRGKVGAVRLYEALESWAKVMGAKRLSMACVCNESMGSVRDFYEAKGFMPKDVSYFKSI